MDDKSADADFACKNFSEQSNGHITSWLLNVTAAVKLRVFIYSQAGNFSSFLKLISYLMCGVCAFIFVPDCW